MDGMGTTTSTYLRQVPYPTTPQSPWNRAGVKRTALNFKGEAGREKKKRRGKAEGWDQWFHVRKGGVMQQESEDLVSCCVCVFFVFSNVF